MVASMPRRLGVVEYYMVALAMHLVQELNASTVAWSLYSGEGYWMRTS